MSRKLGVLLTLHMDLTRSTASKRHFTPVKSGAKYVIASIALFL
ncbi:hypothetical protein [Paenibacillus illinoisensis]